MSAPPVRKALDSAAMNSSTDGNVAYAPFGRIGVYSITFNGLRQLPHVGRLGQNHARPERIA